MKFIEYSKSFLRENKQSDQQSTMTTYWLVIPSTGSFAIFNLPKDIEERLDTDEEFEEYMALEQALERIDYQSWNGVKLNPYKDLAEWGRMTDYTDYRPKKKKLKIVDKSSKKEKKIVPSKKEQKWDKLVQWIKDTKDSEYSDIWDFLADDLGVSTLGEYNENF